MNRRCAGAPLLVKTERVLSEEELGLGNGNGKNGGRRTGLARKEPSSLRAGTLVTSKRERTWRHAAIIVKNKSMPWYRRFVVLGPRVAQILALAQTGCCMVLRLHLRWPPLGFAASYLHTNLISPRSVGRPCACAGCSIRVHARPPPSPPPPAQSTEHSIMIDGSSGAAAATSSALVAESRSHPYHYS